MATLGLSQEAVCVSEAATKAHPSSLPLWLARLSCNDSSLKKVSELCEQALSLVDKEVSDYKQHFGTSIDHCNCLCDTVFIL